MMAKHKVILGPVEHDGTVYQDGEELPIAGDAAATLLAVGVIEAVEQVSGKTRVSVDVH
jgi:hypothetical protein